MTAEPVGLTRRGLLRGLLTEAQVQSLALRPEALAGVPTDGVFWAMARTDEGELFVAGDDGVVGHYSEATWHWETLPGKRNIHAMTVYEDSLVAVGWMGAIYHFCDDGWTLRQGGGTEAEAINQPLFDVACDAHNKLWAVGDHGRVTCFDGQQWQELKHSCTANLRCVLPLSDGSVLVSGLGGTLIHLCDGVWRSIATDTGCPLVSMAQLPGGEVMIAGGEYSIEAQAFRGRLYLFSDGAVRALKTPDTLPRLRRVKRDGDSVVLLGDAGFALRWNGEEAEQLHNAARYDLHDLVIDEDQTWCCGDSASIMKLTTLSDDATSMDQPISQCWDVLSQGETLGTLRALWPLGDGTLLAAGDGGKVAYISDNEVRWEQVPDGLRMHALWGSSPRNVFAACEGGSILHYDGEHWQLMHRGKPGNALLAITGFGPHDIFAVGDNGYALRYDGLMWRELETGVKQELYGVWGQDSDHLLAVGGGGQVLRWNGKAWKSFYAGTDHDLYGVSGRGLSQLLLCGLSGTLIRFTGASWDREFTGVRSDLHAVTLGEGGHYCVGSHGTVLRESSDEHGQPRWDLEQGDFTGTLHAIVSTETGVWAAGAHGLVVRRR